MRKVRTLKGIQDIREVQDTAKPKRFLRHILSTFLAIGIGSLGVWWWNSHPQPATSPLANTNLVTDVEASPTPKPAEYKEYVVQEKDIPADIFTAQAGYNSNDIDAILKSAGETHDLTKLIIGKSLRIYFEDTEDKERASRVEYYKNTESVLVVTREGDDFKVAEEKIQYQVREGVAKGTIDNFFYVDALEAGLQEATILDVGDIFSSAIDFTTEIQQGDSFVFIYEERKKDDKRAGDGKILAAKFVNGGETHFAYHFEHNGESQYYDQDGHAIQRQFLKAPLTYRAITSGFTGARMHPITKTVHAHFQIDYAAPVGTPVVSTANGTVSAVGFEGGWGNIVRITHQNGYTTHYAHLSAFASGLKSGSSVNQGQIVGYVGSTGWSTGPHLDYGMKLNGNPLNPLELKQPKGEALPEDARAAFENLKAKYQSSLE